MKNHLRRFLYPKIILSNFFMEPSKKNYIELLSRREGRRKTLLPDTGRRIPMNDCR